MPPKVRITRQMIADAAFGIAREQGHESLNARSIADRLGCSTQPVLYSFRTVDEIRQAAYEKADAYHTAFIMPGEADENPMLTLGLNYVRFGHEERNLFRFLFQTNQFGGKDIEALFSDPDLSPVLDVIASQMQVSQAEARQAFFAFFCVAHGMASLLANNAMRYDENQCGEMLKQVYLGVTATRKEEPYV